MAFLYSKWLALSLSTRQAIAKELGIAKTGSTHVQDNKIVSDGYDIKTVEDALEAHEGDWDEIVDKAEGRSIEKGLVNDSMQQTKEDMDAIRKIVNDTEEKITPKKTTRAKPARRKGK